MNTVEKIRFLIVEINKLLIANRLNLFDKDKSIYTEAKALVHDLDDMGEKYCHVLLARLEIVYQHLDANSKKEAIPMDYHYPFGLKFSDLKNLVKVNDSDSKNETYIYFEPELIRDYHKAVKNEHDILFASLIQRPEYCRARGENGLKALGHADAPKCEAWLNSQQYKTTITHELKINAAARIGFFSLHPLENGPVILIASHYLEHGIHSDRKEEKNKPHKTANFFAKPNISLQCAAIGQFAKPTATALANVSINPSTDQIIKSMSGG